MTIEEKAKEYVIKTLCNNGCLQLNKTFDCCEGINLSIKTFIAGVEEATRWIPVEESLPNEKGQYLVQKDGYIKLLVFNPNFNCWDDEDGDDFCCDADKILCWRPIEFS